MSAFNISIYIEIMSLAFPQYFLALASIANAGKNICFLTAGASRASINVKFAKRNNIGDIVGKQTNQFTTTSLMGMGLGSLLTQVIDISSIPQLLPTLLVLSAVNTFTSLRSSRLVDESSLNNQRINILFDEFHKTGKLETMANINLAERLLLPNFLNGQHCKFIKFGEKSMSNILSTNYFATSMLHQLHKTDR